MHRLRTSRSSNRLPLRSHSSRRNLQKNNPLSDKDRSEARQGSIASSEYRPNSAEVWSDAIEDQRDGFYRYSESLTQEEKREASLNITQDLESPDLSMMSSRRPYSISSDQWVVTTAPNSAVTTPATTPGCSPTDPLCPVPHALPLDGLDDAEIAMHFHSVLQTFSQVYFVSRFMLILYLAYGIEVADDTGGTGLMYWIEYADNRLHTDSLVELIEITENLFYATYGRIHLQLAAIELASTFRLEIRLPSDKQVTFTLPEARHVYQIVIACKDILDSPSISNDRDEDTITRFQEAYVRFLIWKHSHLGQFRADDILGFRRYAMSVVSNHGSGFSKKWIELLSFWRDIPPETITLLSERYFTITPSAWPAQDISTEDLPFIQLETLDACTWEREVTSYHRTGTLAQLEGKSIGEVRREDKSISLMHLARRRQCTCKPVCYCSEWCTDALGEQPCPCAERQLRLMLAMNRRRTVRFDFQSHVESILMSGFEGLALMKRDYDDDEQMFVELWSLYQIIATEIIIERGPRKMSRTSGGSEYR